jgi:molybdopterin converting factor subunit 1
MRVHVLFFGVLRESFGREELWLDLPAGVPVSSVVAHFRSEQPGLENLWSSMAIAVNKEYAAGSVLLAEGDEVALLPPVSGGSPAASLTRDAIVADQVAASVRRGEDGAVVIFDGVVRNNTRGRRTLFLDYEAYETMALTQMESLVAEARARFPIRDAAIVHRLGRIEIGETSVLIVVASAHRGAAFDACRWIIDTLKQTVPIWKKEHFVDGAVWADGEPFPQELTGGRG